MIALVKRLVFITYWPGGQGLQVSANSDDPPSENVPGAQYVHWLAPSGALV